MQKIYSDGYRSFKGRLRIVATPIGDKDDITLRAIQALREATVIAAEDTRVARDRLGEWGIFEKKILSCWDQNEAARLPELLSWLEEGDVCLISDAGMPLVSDPGYRVVQGCLAAGVEIDVLPGASAVVTALAGSGLPTDRFYFGGFLPRDVGPKNKALEELASLRSTLIFYESPQRLAETLALLHGLWPNRKLCVARNLTRRFEQWIRGTAQEVRELLGEETRGEVTLLIEGASERVASEEASVDAQIDALLAAGRPLKEIRDALHEATRMPKRELYQRILSRAGASS